MWLSEKENCVVTGKWRSEFLIFGKEKNEQESKKKNGQKF